MSKYYVIYSLSVLNDKMITVGPYDEEKAKCQRNDIKTFEYVTDCVLLDEETYEYFVKSNLLEKVSKKIDNLRIT